MKGCVYTLSTGEKLDYDQMREHLLNNYQQLLDNNGTLMPSKSKPSPSVPSQSRLTSTAQKARKTYESIINRAEGISQGQREQLKSDPNRYYTPQSSTESQKAAQEIIAEVGLDNAVEYATSSDESIPEVIKIAILGQAVNDYSKNKDYDTEADTYDKFREATEILAKKATQLGRAIAQLKQVYKLSGLGMVARLQKVIEKKRLEYTEKDIQSNLEKVREELRKQFGDFSIPEGSIEKVVKEKTENQNKAINLVRRLRKNIKDNNKGKLYDASIGIPLAILDMGLAALEQALIAGVALKDAIDVAITKMKAQAQKENKTFDEKKFIQYIKDNIGEDFYNELIKEDEISLQPDKNMVENAQKKLEARNKKLKIGNIELTASSVHKIFKIILKEQAKGGKFNLKDETVSNNINNAILEGLGLKLSKEDSDLAMELTEKLKYKDIPYYVARQYEEIMQYLLKSYQLNSLIREVLLEGMIASMLTSVINTLQNTLGFLKVVSTLFTVMAKSRSIKNPLSVFLKELSLARSEAATIMKGRVSRGISYKDMIEGKTQGEVSVRFLEYYKSDNWFWKAVTFQRNVSRFLEATDTFASAASSGLNDYLKIKAYVNKFYPELDAKQKAQIEFDIMYGNVTQADKDKAKDDLIKSGITNPTQAEINRTTYERLVRARDDKAKAEYDKILKEKIEEAKLLGISSNKQEEWARLLLGDFDYVVASGQERAQIDTGKLDTIGLATAIAQVYDFAINGIKGGLNKQGYTSVTSGVNIVSRIGLFPFVASIARWTEIAMELTPYGLVKGAAYKAVAVGQMRKDETKKLGEKNMDLGTDFIMRGFLGTLYSAGIFAVIGAINASLKGDDDEEEEKEGAVSTFNKKERIGEEKVASAFKPKQSIKIGDRYLPIQTLGSAYVPVMFWASMKEQFDAAVKKNEKLSPEEKDNLALSMVSAGVATMLTTALESSWYQAAERYGAIGKFDKGLPPALGTMIGKVFGAAIPGNRFQQEVAQLLQPQSKEQKNFLINVVNQMSIVRAFTPGNANFDFRGRNYDVGQIYANTIDGYRKFLFGAPQYRDEIDNWLTDIKYAASNSYRNTKSEDINAYHKFDDDGRMRNLTDEEWYEFRLVSAKKFNENIVDYYNSKSWERLVYTDENGNPQPDNEARRKMVSKILKLSKEYAIATLNNMSTKQYEKITKKEEEQLEDKGANKMQEKESKLIEKRYSF